MSTSATAASPASSVSRRRHGDATWVPDPAARTGSPTSWALTPAGGCRLERIVSISCCCSANGISRIPNASVATRRSGVITSWEKYGGIAASRPCTSPCVSFGVVVAA